MIMLMVVTTYSDNEHNELQIACMYVCMYVCAVYSLQTINYQPTNCLDQDAVALSSAALAQALGVGCIGATLRLQNIGILRL